jgi:hypothetical protein
MSTALINPSSDEMAQAAHESGLIDVPDSLTQRSGFRLGYKYEPAPRPVIVERKDYRPTGHFYAVWRGGYAVYEGGKWITHEDDSLVKRFWRRFIAWL